MANLTTEPTPPYDRDAIFRRDSPIDPSCVMEAVAAIKRAMPIDPEEPHDAVSRRMHCTLRSLSALNARDEIELMLGVQALSAYYAACACWRLGMNLVLPNGDSTRHIATAASAARAFDSMLRALERRQAKPLTVPVGRPEPREWAVSEEGETGEVWTRLCSIDPGDICRPMPLAAPFDPSKANDDEILDATWLEDEEDDQDLDMVEGILPGGGMIAPEEPTPQQAVYLERRLRMMYRREREEKRRNGILGPTRFRPLRDGDMVP